MKLLPKSQDFLEIIDIKDGVLVLSGGKFRVVIEATAINFDLLSEDEQNATIFAYSNLVNSLNYPIQILVRTRQVDITNYLSYLKKYLRDQPTAALREQLQDYIDFCQQLVLENIVLQKRFFVVIPYWQSSTTGPSTPQKKAKSPGLLDGLPLIGKKSTTQPLVDDTIYSEEAFKKAKQSLNQRYEEVRWQFKRLGIQVRLLGTEELIRLYYEILNPETGQNRGLKDDLYGYTVPIVNSALDIGEY
ncbi:hypothetical protein HGA91_01600 [candidate division WWE3 bacterium]|nr:hypothetical protein [candidate division WWE3 bacterium]